MRISIPAGDLAETLSKISRATGKRIEFDPDAVRGQRAWAVRGASSPREAVLQAVKNTNLAIRIDADGSLTVFRSDAAQEGDIVVTAQRDEAETNYRVNKATTSDRSGGTLRELPQNTAVVSNKLMRDQQVQTVDEAMRNVAGATVSRNAGQGLTSFAVRGFGVAPVTNGTGQTANAANAGGSIQPLSSVERIEVLKGPAAILAGQRNLGGIINIVTKKPLSDPLLNLTAEYQSRGSFRGIIDASNALTSDKLLSARIIAEVQHADRNYGGYDGRETYLFAPSLRFKNASTDIIGGLSTTEQRQPAVYFTAFNTVANSPTPVGELIDRPRAPIGREDAGIDISNTRYYVDATQTFASWLTLTARGEHYNQSVDLQPVSPLGVLPTYGTFLFSNSHARDDSKGNSVDAFVRSKFSTFGVSHTLVGGFNYTDLAIQHFDASSGFVPINILDPNVRIGRANALASAVSFSIDYKERGAYLQDLIEYGPVHLSVAYRKNWYDALTVQPARNRRLQEKATSGVPAFGLVVDITSNLSIYGNYSKGFIPTTALAFDGSALPDIRSTNKEVGVKADLFNDRASLVVSAFELQQDNRIIADVSHPSFSLSIPGGQRARGFDTTFTGRIMPNLNINATYAYTKFDFANPSVAAAAGLLVVDGQPSHSYSLFASYEGPRGKIGGAMGVFGQSSSPVTYTTFPAPTFRRVQSIYTVPGGAQLDANVYFAVAGARLNLGVKNIFDKRLYSPTTSTVIVPVSDGRTLTATLSYRFF